MDPNAIARVRFVTERYSSLQGFRQVIAGTGFISIVSVATGVAGWPPGGVALVLTGIPGVIAIALGMRAAERYYATRFGRAKQNVDSSFWSVVVMTAALTLLDKLSGERLFPGVMGVIVAGLAAWRVVRDWPFRPHYLAGIAAGVAISLPWPVGATSTWFARYALLGGAAMLVQGYFDHRLLLRSLPPRAQDALSNAESL